MRKLRDGRATTTAILFVPLKSAMLCLFNPVYLSSTSYKIRVNLFCVKNINVHVNVLNQKFLICFVDSYELLEP